MSADFKRMIEQILKQKPEISAEHIREMVDDKKRKIGAGYLTDQGALFLVAADLGISFENTSKLYVGLKDLYVGAKDISVTGRIMNIYPIRKFARKDTNEEVRNRTLTIYDSESNVRVKLWDDQINIPDEMGLRPGQLIKISRGYVKSGLDGRPIINLSSNGVIENIIEDDSSIPNIESITMRVDDVKQPQENVIIMGRVNSSPRISEFNNIRGQPSKSLQMEISNESYSRSLRVIIWNVDEGRIPKVFTIGAMVRLLGVKIKIGNPQYGKGDFEIHGDEGTMFDFFGSQTDVEVMPLRIISVGQETGKGNANCLAIERSGRLLYIIIDSLLMSDELVPGTMVECVPSRIFGAFITLSKDDSYIRIIDDDPSFPNITKFESKIKDVQVSENPYIIEAIVLQPPNTSEVNTKSGEVIPVADTFLGDDTGEIRVVGWRQQSSYINKLNVGERIKVICATANNGTEDKVELTLRPYSSLLKIS